MGTIQMGTIQRLGATIVVCLSLVMSSFAFAQTKPALSGGTTITPLIIEAGVDPGDERIEEVKVTNQEGYNRTFGLKFLYAAVSPISGDLSLVANAGAEVAQNSLSSWMSLVDEKDSARVIGPGSDYTFKFRVKIPANAQPGAHYAMVQATEGVELPTGGTGSGIGSTLTSVVAYTVSGEVIEKGLVRSFQSNKKVYFDQNLGFKSVLENLGNAHFVPNGFIDITNVFGKKVAHIVFNEKGTRTLPASQRLYTTDFPDAGLALGMYTATLGISFGSVSKQSLVQDVTFFVMPLLQFVVLLVVVVGIYIWMRRWKSQLAKEYARTGKPSDGKNSYKKTLILIAIVAALLLFTLLR